MVYTHDLKSCLARDVGSSPTSGKKYNKLCLVSLPAEKAGDLVTDKLLRNFPRPYLIKFLKQKFYSDLQIPHSSIRFAHCLVRDSPLQGADFPLPSNMENLFKSSRKPSSWLATRMPREGFEPPTISLRGSCSTN